MRRFTFFLLGAMTFLTFGDAITTWLVLDQNGGREVNPWMAALFRLVSVEGGLAIKMLVTLCGFWFIGWAVRHTPRVVPVAFPMLLVLTAVYATVVVSNATYI